MARNTALSVRRLYYCCGCKYQVFYSRTEISISISTNKARFKMRRGNSATSKRLVLGTVHRHFQQELPIKKQYTTHNTHRDQCTYGGRWLIFLRVLARPLTMVRGSCRQVQRLEQPCLFYSLVELYLRFLGTDSFNNVATDSTDILSSTSCVAPRTSGAAQISTRN